MRHIIYILQVLGTKKVLIAFSVWLTVVLSIYFLLLKPENDRAGQLETKKQEMSEFYIQIKGADIDSILKILNLEVSLLGNSDEATDGMSIEREQLPFIITRLERTAQKSGLRAESTLVMEKKKGKPERARIHLRFAGLFSGIRDFLDQLQQDKESVTIADFVLRRSAENNELLKGEIEVVCNLNKT